MYIITYFHTINVNIIIIADSVESLQHENQKLEAAIDRQNNELLELRSLSSKLRAELSQLNEKHSLLAVSYDAMRYHTFYAIKKI